MTSSRTWLVSFVGSLAIASPDRRADPRPVSGATGEGAVAVGGFTAPGQGSVVIPAGTPGDTFLVTVECNGGALHGEQPSTLGAPVGGPATPVTANPSFTG